MKHVSWQHGVRAILTVMVVATQGCGQNQPGSMPKSTIIGNETMHTNRLIHDKSPYLLQHARNPVDWYPWGEEAFTKARKENKPIFLSIGYSTCHWCHVMAHESFENAEIANIFNEYFVGIKVDREERPDVDRVYMTFVQATTGGGAGQAFFAGHVGFINDVTPTNGRATAYVCENFVCQLPTSDVKELARILKVEK